MVYTKEYQKALRTRLLAEAISTLELTAADTCAALSDELHDMFPGKYAYIRDVIGDGESGDVIYCCDGDTWRAPYEIGMVNGKRTCTIDDDQAINVVPRTVYDEEADESDHYAGMDETDATEAKRMPAFMRRMIFTERFVSKAERDAADSGDFAGKGKSFPILKPGDVMAAVRSMGRAGADNKGADSLKASIIRIAKKKGWAKYLPKAWQGDSADTTESGGARSPSPLILVESAGGFLDELQIREARTDYPIKLISPGTGSMAHYPAEVLKRDGPKVFGTGTLMFWNHPTKAEEAARPEGDLNNLAAILTSKAEWQENGKHGPGLYANAKVMADYAQKIEERAPHIGLSIRAGGTGTGKTVNGKPELASIDYAESVDYVTRAGRGGIALAEAAKDAGILTEQETDMDEAQVKRLIESAVAAATAPLLETSTKLRERAVRGDALIEANKILAPITLSEATKQRVVENVLRDVPLKDGELDMPKFAELVNAEAKREGAYVSSLTGGGRVTGMGPTSASGEPTETELKEAKRARKEAKAIRESAVSTFMAFGMDEKAAKLAAEGRAA